MCLIEGEMLVGEKWIRGDENLTPAEPGQADAVALTIISALSKEGSMALIRAARNLNPKIRVFFRRENTASSNGP